MTDLRIVDDDTLLLALDEFFRHGMKRVESGELLACAESVASELAVLPAECPIEGYYHEKPELTRYFRLMRSLQKVEKARRRELSDDRSLQRLRQVSGSTLFGTGDQSDDLLLPRQIDVLAMALDTLAPDWKLPEVLTRARELTSESDHSLVGMACRFGSPYVVAALRETVALYAAHMGGSGAIEPPEYRWEVSSDLEQLANRFVATVSTDLGFDIPQATADNVRKYYLTGSAADIIGRCIAIGFNDNVSPMVYYHWAIRLEDGKPAVEEFWDEELWTTERYSGQHDRVRFQPIDTSRPLCRREGCEEHSIKLSLFCRQHHEEMLWGTRDS